jgi:hypothetical protein
MQFGLSEFEQLTPREKNFLVLFVLNQRLLNWHCDAPIENHPWLEHNAANDNDKVELPYPDAGFDFHLHDIVVNFVKCWIACKFDPVLTKLTFDPSHSYG